MILVGSIFSLEVIVACSLEKINPPKMRNMSKDFLSRVAKEMLLPWLLENEGSYQDPVVFVFD